jgi:hypothetical protein
MRFLAKWIGFLHHNSHANNVFVVYHMIRLKLEIIFSIELYIQKYNSSKIVTTIHEKRVKTT